MNNNNNNTYYAKRTVLNPINPEVIYFYFESIENLQTFLSESFAFNARQARENKLYPHLEYIREDKRFQLFEVNEKEIKEEMSILDKGLRWFIFDGDYYVKNYKRFEYEYYTSTLKWGNYRNNEPKEDDNRWIPCVLFDQDVGVIH